MAHFILIKDDAKKAPDLASVFAKEIWYHHGLLIDIISDQIVIYL
jgi:hypothetical protein